MQKEEIKKIIAENRDTLAKYMVKSISIFGSYARGEQREDSDIDFLVTFDKGATLYTVVDLQECLSELTGKNVQIISRNGLNRLLEPYILREAEEINEGL